MTALACGVLMCLYPGADIFYLMCLQGGGMMTAVAGMGMAVEAAS